MVNEYSTKILLKKFWKFLSEFKFEIFVAIFLTILSVNILVYAPKLVGRIVNSILNFYVLENEVQIFESFDDLIQISILYTVGYSLRIPISTIMAKISEKTTANLKSALNDKLNYLSPNTFNDEYSGNVLARLNNDVANIKSFVNKTTILFLSDVLIIIFVIFAAITMNFKLSLLFLGILPIYTIIIYVAHRKTISNYKSYQDILGKQMGHIGIFLPNRLMINLLNSDNFSKKYFKSLNSEQKDVYIKSRFYSDIANPASSLLTYAVQLLLYSIAGYMVVNGGISLGEFSTFALYIQLFKKPFLSLTGTFNSIRVAFSSLNRVLEILELPDDINPDASVLNKEDVKGDIEFKDISYKNISNLNLKIQSGEIINLVGESKDDLIDLLLLFDKTDNEKILLDGEDIAQYTPNSYRGVYGVSLEDDWIASESVRDNISYADRDIGMDKIVETTKLLGIHELIEKFPDGYDTKLSNDFKNFSSGEGKLICVARALMADSKILILNYPNYLSVEKLKTITEGKTVLILTPDDTLIDFADKTVYLD